MLFLFTAACTIQFAEVWFNLQVSQPQARHLYPFLVAVIFPVGVGLERLGLLKPIALFSLVLSIAALPMLLGRLRAEGWNESPGISVTDQARAPKPNLLAQDAKVYWLVNGQPILDHPIASSDQVSGGPPPSLAWEARPDHFYELYFAFGNPTMVNQIWSPTGGLFRVSEFAGRMIGGSFQFPTNIWDDLEPGLVLSLQVVELSGAGEATGFSLRRQITR
jgi:hypothetical protein